MIYATKRSMTSDFWGSRARESISTSNSDQKRGKTSLKLSLNNDIKFCQFFFMMETLKL